jgi:hypothetical protein
VVERIEPLKDYREFPSVRGRGDPGASSPLWLILLVGA